MQEKRLGILEHLGELRSRIIVCLVSVLIFSLISFRYAKEILSFLTRPVENLVFISPLELFLVYLKVAILGGIILSSPIIFYQIWSFIKPGLYPYERKNIKIFFFFSLLLFLSGIFFSYFVIFPLGIKFLLSFSTEKIKPLFSVSRYLSFFLMLIFATGIVFETPIVIIFLTKLKILTPKILLRNWRLAIVSAFIISAIITPTVDIFTQTLLAFPMIFFYIISVLIAKLFWGDKKPLDKL